MACPPWVQRFKELAKSQDLLESQVKVGGLEKKEGEGGGGGEIRWRRRKRMGGHLLRIQNKAGNVDRFNKSWALMD